jgi:SAM-dependent methyltransferase
LAEFIKQRLRDSRLTVVRSVFPDSLIHGQFDLIACAAAFHWLEPGPALAKVRELLATGGVWGLWWHSYWNPGMGDELADAISPLLKDVPLPPSMTIRGHCSLDERMHRRMLEEAGFRAIEYRLYRCERELTTQDVLSLYKSYSFVRLLPIERRVRLLENLAQIVEKRFGGIAPNLVLTPLYFASL